tara:strand:- start:557 stop:1150 length:594 start_codon:yes stop_codon:yes gene_type:complete
MNYDMELLSALVQADAVPEWLESRVKQQVSQIDREVEKNTERFLTINGEREPGANDIADRPLGDDALEWARDCICSDIYEVRLHSTIPGRNHFGAHTDCTRDFSIIYLLEDGGPEQETVFYREHGKSVLRTEKRIWADNYDILTPIASVKIDVKNYTLLNGMIIHGVNNVPEGRNQIQFSISDISKLKLSHRVYLAK